MMLSIFFKILRFSAVPFLIRELIQRNKVTILLFHDLSAADADRNFAYLMRRYNIISLDLLIEALESKDWSKIPKKAMIITFDDGHLSNYSLLPVFRKLKIPATIFLCSSIINTQRMYWFKFNSEGLNISSLKHLSNKERLRILEQHSFNQESDFPHRSAMNKKETLDLSSFVNMQSHTQFHPILPNCSDEESLRELSNSKLQLESDYGFTINTISYPNGDYSNRDIEFARSAGYRCGITVDFGYNDVNSDLFRLKRISANDTSNIDELAVKSCGLWVFLKYKGGRRQPYGFQESRFRN